MMNITGKEGRAVADKSGRIGPLDGIRAVAVLMVVWYHFWQQSWLMPVAGPVNLDWMPRNGAICVDLMILLSGSVFFTLCKKYVPGRKRPFGRTCLPQKGGSHYALVLCITFDLYWFALPFL